MFPPIDRGRRIAIHEAGHVVVARVLALPGCGEASIVEPFAHARFPCDHGTRSIRCVDGRRGRRGGRVRRHDKVGFTADARRVRERLQLLGISDGGGALLDYTRALVRANFECVKFLANMLRRAGTLDGSVIDRIVR